MNEHFLSFSFQIQRKRRQKLKTDFRNKVLWFCDMKHEFMKSSNVFGDKKGKVLCGSRCEVEMFRRTLNETQLIVNIASARKVEAR
jgi:hypothetical protein